MQVSQFLATQALSIGQDTFQFVISFGIMLYLLFFLLRDGPRLSARISRAIPLSETHKHHLLLKFTTVVRATVRATSPWPRRRVRWAGSCSRSWASRAPCCGA